MVDPVWWLGVWEELDAPGKHDIKLPAPDGFGYVYCRSYYGTKVPWNAGPRYTMWDRVNRAIPVDGTVTDVPPSWTQSPQARFWLEPENVGIWARIKKWLMREVRP